MEYRVSGIRAAGVECRWTRTRSGAPIIAGKSGERWFVIDDKMWSRAEKVGIAQAFAEHTALGDIFSITA